MSDVSGSAYLARPLEVRPRQSEAQHLKLVERRSRRRVGGGRLLFLVASGVVIAVAFGLVYLHVVMAQRQFQLDDLNAKVAREQSQYQALRLKVAQLDSPQAIISTAEGKLGMRQPPSVVYLNPKTPSASQPGTAQAGTPQAGSAGGSAGKAGRGLPAPGGDADWPQIKSELAGSP